MLLQRSLFSRSPNSCWLLPLPCVYRDETLLRWVCRAMLGSRFKLLRFTEWRFVLCKHRGSKWHDDCPAHVIRLHITVAGCVSTACSIQKDSLDDLKIPLAIRKKKKNHRVFALICNGWGCSLWVQCCRYGGCFKLKCCCWLAVEHCARADGLCASLYPRCLC